jgi:hypothetical protein
MKNDALRRLLLPEKIAIGFGVLLLIVSVIINICARHGDAGHDDSAFNKDMKAGLAIQTLEWWQPPGSKFVVGQKDINGKYLFRAFQDDKEIIRVKMISSDGGYSPLEVCGKIRGSEMKKVPMVLMDCVVFE